MEESTIILFGLLSVFLGAFHLADSSNCPDSFYHVDIVGCDFASPNPEWAYRGVPFFPKWETDRKKCFSVQSGSDVAIYLSPTAAILDKDSDDYYEIIIEIAGDISIARSGMSPQATAPFSTPLGANTAADICVSVLEDGTIHVEDHDGGELVSWKDTNLIDVNYILVHKYDDPDEATALFDFCDGVVKLLSQNGRVQTITATHNADDDTWSADNAIDGDLGGVYDGVASSGACSRTSTTDTSGYAYWKLDLGGLYDIKAVNILDGYEYGCPKGWRYYGSACYRSSNWDGTDRATTWADARQDCIDEGGDLVTIRTPAITEFLQSWLDTTGDYWLGLTVTVIGDWNWAAETNIEFNFYDNDNDLGTEYPIYYGNWQTGQPDTSGLCVAWMLSDAVDPKWEEVGCGDSHNYICQRSLCDVDQRLFGDACYEYYVDDELWLVASDTCDDEERGSLLTLDSPYIQGAINDWVWTMAGLVPALAVWTGLADLDADGDFQWEETGTTVWVNGEPPPYDEGHPVPGQWTSFYFEDPVAGDCVVYDSDSDLWFGIPCAAPVTIPFVCQIAPPEESRLIGAEVYIGTCPIDPADATDPVSLDLIRQNHACSGRSGLSDNQADIDNNDIGHLGDPTWVLRLCEDEGKSYYGRYIYILKEKASPDTWFSLCEVEVWGAEIAEEEYPKVELTPTSWEDLENSLADASPFAVTATRTHGNAANKLCCDITVSATISASFDNPASFYTSSPDDEDEDFTTSPNPVSFSFDKDSDDTATFTVSVFDDDCPAPDEQFGFEISFDNNGMCAVAGDAVVYNILNDDVTYCWEDLSLSVNENTLEVTAVLTRYGYLDRATDAVVQTLGMGDLGGLTAENNVDFETIAAGPAGTYTFGPGVTEIPITVTILEDVDCETTTAEDETFVLRLVESMSDGKICEDAGGDLADVTVTILHDDVTFTFNQPEYDVMEDGTVEVVVELVDGPVNHDVSVDVRTQSSGPMDAAESDVDFIESDIDTRLTIPAGYTRASLTITVVDDLLVEADEEHFELILVPVPDTLPGCVAMDTAQINIHDNDCEIRIDPETLSLREGSTTLGVITILCKRPEGSMATVNFPMTATLVFSTENIGGNPAASDLTDYTVLRTTVALTGESTNVTVFRLTDDIIEETPEYFEISLVSVDDGQIVPPETAMVEILDNDVTVQISSCGANGMVVESGENARIFVNRTGDLSESDSVLILTIPVTATPGSTGTGDFVGINKPLTFAAMESVITEDIIIIDDLIPENDEEFIVQILRQNNNTHVDTTLDICRVTIKDDDCTFYLSTVEDDSIIPESDKQVSVIVSRTGNVEKGALVSIQTSDVVDRPSRNTATAGEDYTPISRQISFGPDDDTETVMIPITDDDEVESVEYFQVKLADGGCYINRGSRLLIGIADEEDETIVRMRDAEVTVNEDEGTACVVLSRSGSIGRVDVVSVRVTPRAITGRSTAATANKDFDDADFDVTFDQDDRETEACVTIYDDDIEEVGLESFSIFISRAEEASTGQLATIDNDNRETIVFIRDDDGMLYLNCPDKRVLESSGSVTCIVERSGSTAESQTAYVSTSNGDALSMSDYEPLSGESVSLPSGASSATFSIKIFDDKELEGSQEFFVFLTDSTGTDLGQIATILTIVDNDNAVKIARVNGFRSTETSVTVDESIGTMRLTVQRDAYGFNVATGTTTVRVRSHQINLGDAGTAEVADGQGVDYADLDADVIFAVGQQRVDFEIQIIDDVFEEKQEAFEVVIVDATPESNNVIVHPRLITVYINDNDSGMGEDDGDVDDAGGDGDDSDGGLSRSIIVGIGGGIGLLLLLGVVGVIGCVSFSRYNQRQAAPTRPGVTASRAPPGLRGGPVPPQYYNPYVDNGRGRTGRPPIYYR